MNHYHFTNHEHLPLEHQVDIKTKEGCIEIMKSHSMKLDENLIYNIASTIKYNSNTGNLFLFKK